MPLPIIGKIRSPSNGLLAASRQMAEMEASLDRLQWSRNEAELTANVFTASGGFT